MSKNRGQINAREKALIEEEKWLIENLKKIRKQRNDLEGRIIYFAELREKVIRTHNAAAGGDGLSQNAAAGGDGLSQNAAAGGDVHSLRHMFALEREKEPEIPEPVGGTSSSNIDDSNSVEERCNLMKKLKLKKNNLRMSESATEDQDMLDWDKVQLDMGLIISGECDNFQTGTGNKNK